MNLGKMQKLILVYIGVKTEKGKYINRILFTDDLSDILNREKDHQFCVAVDQALKSLIKHDLIQRRGRFIRLRRDGREIARGVVDCIKSEYGDINWEIVKNYFHQGEEIV